ncbi:MAG: hypothetical protein GY730_01795, partial [bacterium]|nr:hypothetical protein [bacterium]
EILKIYIKFDECVVYDAEDCNEKICMHVFAYGKTEERDKQLDTNFFEIGLYWKKAVASLYKSLNAIEVKRHIAHALSVGILGNIQESKNLFDNLLKDLNENYRKINLNKITFALTHLLSLLLTLSIAFLFYFKIQGSAAENIMFCIMGSVIGGYLMTTIGSSNFLFTPEATLRRYIFYAIERNVVSVFLGVAAYALSKSGFALSFLTQIDNVSSYSALVLGLLSGYFESFVPSLLFNIKDDLLTE